MTRTQARKRKCEQIRICRRYLAVAKHLNLSEKSATVRGWKRQLQILRDMPLTKIAAYEG